MDSAKYDSNRDNACYGFRGALEEEVFGTAEDQEGEFVAHPDIDCCADVVGFVPPEGIAGNGTADVGKCSDLLF